MLMDATLSAFADETAARQPTPGGGSVAAYVAALGAALGCMAARYTEGRKGFEEHAAALGADIALLEALRGGFQDLVQEDASVYAVLNSAYGLPRDDEQQKAERRQAIQSALSDAMDAPLRACRAAVSGLEVLAGLAGHVNPNLASDVAVGAHLLGAAFRSAWVNVLINLKGLRDEDVRRRVLDEGRELADRATRLTAQVTGSIEASLVA